MVRELPRVNLNGRSYFVDGRLGEIRDVDNPHNSMSIKSMTVEEFVVILEQLPAEEMILVEGGM